MTWISGPKATIDLMRRAIAKHLDVPRKATHVGRACRSRVPDTYTPGAKGWTDAPVRVADNASGTQSAIEVPADLAAELQGQTISVRGVDVVLDFSSGSARPPAAYLRSAGDDGTLRERSREESRVGRDEYEAARVDDAEPQGGRGEPR